MSTQTPDFITCPICRTRFNGTNKKPISLLCGHTCCSSCLHIMHRKQCPLDATPFNQEDIDSFPVNTALLLLVTETKTEDNKPLQTPGDDKIAEQCIGELALYLKPLSLSGGQKSGSSNSITLSRPMQRKLVALVHCQLAEPVGRARAIRAARSLGERTCTELILQHQNQQQLSSMLWAAVRARGCQFLGPAMQEAALKYILLSLEQGEALSRKVLVLYVVQQLEPHFPQASKTSIGHVVQLLYRASCFKVAKRNDDSSLMQLKEEYRTYEALRREHDAQIVNMAQEAGIRIPPDQWSQLLYGDTAHKSHMQSIIDRLQTPASFAQSIQELMIALSRTEDPHNLAALQHDFNMLAAINPATDDTMITWTQLKDALLALRNVVKGLERFLQAKAKTKGIDHNMHTVVCCLDQCNVSNESHGKYKTTMCRDLLLPQGCPRGATCTFAHSQDEMERYRNKKPNRHLTELDSQNGGGHHSEEESCFSNSGSPCQGPPPPPPPQQLSQAQQVQPPQVPQPPTQFPQQNGGIGIAPNAAGAPTNGQHPNQHNRERWNGIMPPEIRTPSTPRLPFQLLTSGATPGPPANLRSHIDQETLQLLQLSQLRQQMLSQGIPTPAPGAGDLTPEILHSLQREHFSSAPAVHRGQNGLSDQFGSVPSNDLHRLHQSVGKDPQTPLWEQVPQAHKLANLSSSGQSLWQFDSAPATVQHIPGFESETSKYDLLRSYQNLSTLANRQGIPSSLLNHPSLQSPHPSLQSPHPSLQHPSLQHTSLPNQHANLPNQHPSLNQHQSLQNHPGLQNGGHPNLQQNQHPSLQQHNLQNSLHHGAPSPALSLSQQGLNNYSNGLNSQGSRGTHSSSPNLLASRINSLQQHSPTENGLQSRDIQGLQQGLQQGRDISQLQQQQGRDISQLQQQQQQGRGDILQQQGRDHDHHALHSVPNNLANYNLGSLSHLLPHSQATTQQLKYELAKAEGQQQQRLKYEQLLGYNNLSGLAHASLLAQLQNAPNGDVRSAVNGLSNSQGLGNTGLSNAQLNNAGLSNGGLGDCRAAANAGYNGYHTGGNAPSETPGLQNNAHSIWQSGNNSDSWQMPHTSPHGISPGTGASRPQSHFSIDHLDSNLQQLLLMDNKFAHQLLLDEIE